MKRRAISFVAGLWLAGGALAETDESPHLVGLMGDMQPLCPQAATVAGG